MKKFNSLLFALGICLFTLAGCSKDDEHGEVHISFYNMLHDREIRIYSIQNDQTPIYTISIGSNKDFRIKFDKGNYILKLFGSDYVPTIGFQIRGGGTTEIYFDQNNSPSIKKF